MYSTKVDLLQNGPVDIIFNPLNAVNIKMRYMFLQGASRIGGYTHFLFLISPFSLCRYVSAFPIVTIKRVYSEEGNLHLDNLVTLHDCRSTGMQCQKVPDGERTPLRVVRCE